MFHYENIDNELPIERTSQSVFYTEVYSDSVIYSVQTVRTSNNCVSAKEERLGALFRTREETYEIL